VRVGLVLGGGGLTGTAFHAGVVTALAEAGGWDAREAAVIVGTSAGATSAALLRAGFPPADYVARVSGGRLSADGAAILGDTPPIGDPPRPSPGGRRTPAAPRLAGAVLRRPWQHRPAVLGAALLPVGSRPLDPMGPSLRGRFSAWPAEPTWITAVSLRDGRRVVFGRDEHAPAVTMADAVAASCAIPGYFAPVAVDDERFVDGGVWSMHHLDLLAGEGLDLVIVSAPLSTTDWVARDRGNLARVPIRTQLEREAAVVRRRGTRVVVVQPDAALRRIMGSSTMVAARRGPVAIAVREYAGALLPAALHDGGR
jgi:NTE family protein